MILYVLKQNKNRKSPAFGKWFAFPVIEGTAAGRQEREDCRPRHLLTRYQEQRWCCV